MGPTFKWKKFLDSGVAQPCSRRSGMDREVKWVAEKGTSPS
jgi:hypothetical protein